MTRLDLSARLAQLPLLMPRLDDETLGRAAAWCAEAGRPATSGEVRAALEALGWDELVAVRALLADPPPARPLGPLALLDVARGVDPSLAAEREKQGQYPSPLPTPCGEPAAAPAGHEEPPRRSADARRKRSAGPFIRRARDRPGPEPEPLPAARPPLLDELLASEGRAVLERLVREHGARRRRILDALASGWRLADGGAPGDEDLSRLLDAHGLARGFARRERDELLHALRAAAGMQSRAAAALGLAPAAFEDALSRLDATREAEAIREARRAELRRRATLTERVRMLLGEPERLEDLGVLPEFQADVRARLPQHVRALRASGAVPLLPALARSLAVAPKDIAALAAGLGLDLGERRRTPPPPPAQAGRRPRPRKAPGPGRGPKRGPAPRQPRR